MLLRATKKRVGGHEFVHADPDDPFWSEAGYVVAEDEDGEWIINDTKDSQAADEDEEEAEEGDSQEAEDESGDEDEEADIEVDLEAMTVEELEQFVAAAELDVDLSKHRLKAQKVTAIEKALEAQNAE